MHRRPIHSALLGTIISDILLLCWNLPDAKMRVQIPGTSMAEGVEHTACCVQKGRESPHTPVLYGTLSCGYWSIAFRGGFSENNDFRLYSQCLLYLGTMESGVRTNHSDGRHVEPWIFFLSAGGVAKHPGSKVRPESKSQVYQN